jgi:hypothetical protein
MKKMVFPKGLHRSLLFFFVFAQGAMCAQPLSVVISEVMYKPSPSVSLPVVEYVELYNRSGLPVRMDGWQLKVGNSSKAIPAVTLQAGSCLLLAAKTDTASLSGYGQVAALPSLSLNNSSQSLFLTDGAGQTVFSFTYRHEWQDAAKQAGGWSLEMADPDFPCTEKGNWRSSDDLSGGTPGRMVPRLPAPRVEEVRLLRAVCTDSQEVSLFFSGKLHPETVWNPVSYRVDGNEAADSVTGFSQDWSSVRLRLRHPLRPKELHEIRVVASLCDCGRRPVGDNPVRLGRSELADSLDLVINEVLFHPKAGGVPFVEIYNRSDKILNLDQLRLSTIRNDGRLDTGKRVSAEGWPLFPGEYAFLSKNAEAVCSQYACCLENAVEMPSFPSYAQSGGRVILLDRGRVLDDFSYSEKMHYPLLASNAGVSLERISPEVATQLDDNWCSAASSAGYATPGTVNSCHAVADVPDDGTLRFESTIFSPDGDGYMDLLVVCYKLPEASLRGSAWICRPDGIPLRRLMNNALLASEGVLVWDGVLDNGTLAPTGAYVLLFEYWSLSGKVERVRKVVTVARRW